MIKRFWLKYNPASMELRVFAGFLGAVIAVVLIGSMAWFSLNKIVTGAQESAKPDKRIFLMKEILSGISDAEGYIKSYTITNDPKYLKPYYELVASIDKRIIKLKKMGKDEHDRKLVDSLSGLVQMKFVVLNQFVDLRDTGRMQAILEDLSARANPGLANVDDGTPGDDKQKGFWSKIFGKRKKITPPVNKAQSGSRDMWTEIEVLRFMEQQNAEEREAALLDITARDQQVMAQIRGMVSRIESEYQTGILEQTKKAESLASQTNVLIGLFCAIVSIALILMGYLIIRYIKKNRDITRQLSIAKNNSEKLAYAKEMFLANMTHEIRTPLHAIIGFAGQLMEDEKTNARNEQIGIIKKSSEHLLKLVNNILDLSKLDSGNLNRAMEVFSPTEVFKEVMMILKPMALEKKINWKFEPKDDHLPKVEGDLISLKQILINLLSNAVKFTDKGGVSLSVKGNTYKEPGVLWLEIKITDTGSGIAADKLPGIFEEFEQAADMTASSFTGTGLGLSIARKLITHLKGTIEIESEKGIGTLAIVHLPYKLSENVIISDKKNVKGQIFKGMHVLVADDEPYNIKLLSAILKKWGVEFETFADGESALEALLGRSFDIALLDLKMPRRNGYEVAKELRKNKEHKNQNIPLLALTASTKAEILENCQSAGINKVLTKPFSEEDLFKIFSEIFPGTMVNNLIPDTEEETQTMVEQETPIAGYYNLNEIYKIADGDEGFAMEMIRTFIESTNKNLELLVKACNASEWPVVGRVAHTMAPPCRHMGMKHIAEMLKRLETTAASGKAEHAREITTQVRYELTLQLEALQQDQENWAINR